MLSDHSELEVESGENVGDTSLNGLYAPLILPLISLTASGSSSKALDNALRQVPSEVLVDLAIGSESELGSLSH